MPSSANSAGYSGTPLWRKLGFDAGVLSVVMGTPRNYADLLGVPAAPVVLGVGAVLPQGTAYLHLFTVHRAEMAQVLTGARHRLAPTGMVWISWPKKASKVPTDITEDTIRDVCLPMGFVDVKVCAVTDVWSGLKLMIRKELR
jgi:hypothetical protein